MIFIFGVIYCGKLFKGICAVEVGNDNTTVLAALYEILLVEVILCTDGICVCDVLVVAV